MVSDMADSCTLVASLIKAGPWLFGSVLRVVTPGNIITYPSLSLSGSFEEGPQPWELFWQNHPAGLAFARLFVEDVASGQSEAVLETLGALRPDRA